MQKEELRDQLLEKIGLFEKPGFEHVERLKIGEVFKRGMYSDSTLRKIKAQHLKGIIGLKHLEILKSGNETIYGAILNPKTIPLFLPSIPLHTNQGYTHKDSKGAYLLNKNKEYTGEYKQLASGEIHVWSAHPDEFIRLVLHALSAK